MEAAVKILLIDDDDFFRDASRRILQDAGHTVFMAGTGEEGLARLSGEHPDLVFVDFRMPGMDGLEFLRQLRMRKSTADVVMLTGYASIEMAVDAIKMGAYDYIPKPFYPEKLLAIVAKIVEKKRLFKTKTKGAFNSEMEGGSWSIIGKSQAMQDVFSLVLKVAPTDSTVLIMGESGTGKELIAKAIQANSLRRKKPFLIMDCGSLVETLFESELFGHVKGSFTGADVTKHGAFELAHGGTFFFDEIGNISMNIQAKILRAIQEKEIRRVGSATTIHVDARVIAATNRDLRRAVEEGTFREDLFYRISVIPIYLPALRDRREDIPLLVQHFINKNNSKRPEPKAIKVSDEVMDVFMKYRWPGNIRELENLIERAFVIEDSDQISLRSLPPHLVAEQGAAQKVLSLDDVEKNYIQKILNENQWNISVSARVLGIDRKTLYEKIKKYGIRVKPL